jgi:hypothetical protein
MIFTGGRAGELAAEPRYLIGYGLTGWAGVATEVGMLRNLC